MLSYRTNNNNTDSSNFIESSSLSGKRWRHRPIPTTSRRESHSMKRLVSLSITAVLAFVAGIFLSCLSSPLGSTKRRNLSSANHEDISRRQLSAPKPKPTNTTKLSRTSKRTRRKPRIPSILLAGTQKASTSSLAVYLMNLNETVGRTCFSDASRNREGYAKESHFFDEKYKGGIELLRDIYKHCPEDSILMDGTPETMLHPERVKSIYDKQGTAHTVKIIFILREPVSREISWYNHQYRYSLLPDRPSWTNNLFDENGNTMSFIEVQRKTVLKNFKNRQWKRLYGYYAYWLRQWTKNFDRKKQILILSYDELIQDPAMLLHRVHRFLNITESGGPLILPRENTNSLKTASPPCADQLELAKHFERPNIELYKFLKNNPGPAAEQRPFPKFQLKCQNPFDSERAAS